MHQMWHYDGFGKPKRIAMSSEINKWNLGDNGLIDNYLGDITDEVVGLIDDILAGADNAQEWNWGMASDYSVYIDPTLEDFQAANRGMMLDQNDYMEDWI